MNSSMSGPAALLSAVALLAVLAFTPAAAADNDTSYYAIDAGPLRQVVERFAGRNDLELSVASGLLEGKHSAGVQGERSLERALQEILAGTGIAYRIEDGGLQLFANGSSEDAAQLEPVTVRGEKLDRTLHETLSSVAVVTAADLAAHADRSLTDVMLRTPGVYAQSGNENWGVRGVPASGFDDQGPVTINGAVAVYVDGVVQPHRAVTVNPLPLWDVGSIEIFRGAQSTQQGRNALAGAIVINTRDPHYAPEFAVQANTGNHGERGVSLLAGGALKENLVAGRFTVDWQETDGYIRNVTLNDDAFARSDLTARGKLLVQPNAQLDLLFMLAHSDREMGENAVVAVNGEPRYYEIEYNTPGTTETVQDSFSASIDYYLDHDWTLTSESTYTTADYDSVLDFDQNPSDRWEVLRVHANDVWTEELRLTYAGQDLRAYTGLYASGISIDADDRLDVEGTNVLHSMTDTRISNTALSGEVNWTFAPRWELVAGIRHDREDNDTEIVYAVDDFGLGSTPQASERMDFSATLPKLGLSYDIDDDHLIGIVVQRGYRAGGVHLRPAAAHESYDPEFTTNYELAYRGMWSKARLVANLYRIEWKDQQVRILHDNGYLQIVNAAQSRLAGMEIAGEYALDQRWNLAAGAAWNDSEYVDFIAAGEDLSGQAFLFSPDSKINAGVTYRTPRITANLDITRQADSVSSYVTDSTGAVIGERRNDAVTLVNISGEYRFDGDLALNAYVKNVLDERYIANNQGDDLLDVGAPRIYGIALRKSW